MLLPDTPGSELPGVFVTGESFWTPGSHFNNFKEHTSIFKENVMLKIYCGLPLTNWGHVSMLRKIVSPKASNRLSSVPSPGSQLQM